MKMRMMDMMLILLKLLTSIPFSWVFTSMSKFMRFMGHGCHYEDDVANLYLTTKAWATQTPQQHPEHERFHYFMNQSLEIKGIC